MASDLKKPLGITILRKRDIPNLLYPLDVKKFLELERKLIQFFMIII
jgi:DNA polymerase-4